MQRYTAHTIVSRRTLSAQLDAALEAGYATTTEEYEPGLNAVAAPIRDHTGAVVAAVSLSGPAYRLDLERLDYVTAGLIKGAEEISARIGHLG
jgi:DNA-binding IclR family transcriptional regulator